MDLLSHQNRINFSESIKVATLLSSPTFYDDRSASPLLIKHNFTPSKTNAIIKKRFLRRGDSLKPSAIEFNRSPVSMYSNESLSPARTLHSVALNSKSSLEDDNTPMSPIVFLNPRDEDEHTERTFIFKLGNCEGSSSPRKIGSPVSPRKRTHLKALKSQCSFRTTLIDLKDLNTSKPSVLSLSKIAERDFSHEGRQTVQKRRVHKISILDSLGAKSREKSNERAVSTLPDEDFSFIFKSKDQGFPSTVKNLQTVRQESSTLEFRNAANFQTTHFGTLSGIHLTQKSASLNEKTTRKDKLIKDWRLSKSKRGSNQSYLDKFTVRKEQDASLDKRESFNFSPIFYGDYNPQDTVALKEITKFNQYQVKKDEDLKNLNHELDLLSSKLQDRVTVPNPLYSVRMKMDKEQEIKRLLKKGKDIHREGALKNTGKKLIKLLIIRLAKIKELKLTLRDVFSHKVFSTEAYQKPGSKELIDACKSANMQKLTKLFETYPRYIVYDFDHVFQTALHFAVKKGFLEGAALLIKNGADVDAKDLTGRTPLYFAIKAGFTDLVQLLIGNGASPWPTEDFSYEKLAKGNFEALSIIKTAKQYHVILRMCSPKMRIACWRYTRIAVILQRIFRTKYLLASKKNQE